MPIQPGLQNTREIRKLNHLVKMWEMPCADPSPEIYLETFFPAFGLAMLSFLLPGTVEVIEMPLGRYHGLGGKVLRGLAKKTVPAWVDFTNKIWKFTLLSYIERILFWWMVIDLIIDTLYNWESLAQQMSGCLPTDLLSTGFAGGGSVYPGTNTWIPIDWQRRFDEGNLIDVTFLRRPAGMVTSVGFGISAQPFFGLLGSYSTRLVDTATGKILHESGIVPPSEHNDHGSGSFRTRDLNGSLFDGAYQVQIKVLNDFVDITDSTVNVGASKISA